MKRLFCFGLGYTGLILARRLQSTGFAIAGTCRRPDQAEALHALDIDAFVFSGREKMPDFERAFQGTTHLLLSVPPDGEGDPALRWHGEDIAQYAAGIAWAGYLSTTGVYGDRDGGWVDEDAPCIPVNERGSRRLAAEEAWEATGLPLHIFRLPGIYGPGRNQLGNLKDGTARRIVKPGQVFSRIHVEDLARALEASIANPHDAQISGKRIYNLCDDEPCPPQDVILFAADLLGVEPPDEIDFDKANLSTMARSFYGESKRVSNRRMKTELGIALRYPTYREGLRALYESGDY